jgi:hypothetical protein
MLHKQIWFHVAKYIPSDVLFTAVMFHKATNLVKTESPSGGNTG